jgi:hypothetical protein
MSSSRLLRAVVAVALSGLACGSSSSPGSDGGGGAGGAIDAPVGTGGTGGTGGSGGTGGTGGTGGSGGAGGTGGSAGMGLGCVGAGTSRCSMAELDPWNQCVLAKCQTEFKACYGAGVQTGTFTGPCGTYVTCAAKCACGDLPCFLACGAPSAECQTCSGTVETCRNGSGCVKPACLQTPDGGPGVTFDGSFPNLPDGFSLPDGFNLPDGLPNLPDGALNGILDSGILSGTCTGLMSCCAAIASTTRKAQCEASYNMVKAFGDLACSAVYLQYKADCP